MSQCIYKYSFDNQFQLKEIENSLFIAALATESLYGRSRLKLDTAFRLEKQKRSCVIDGSTEVGQHIACVFTGLLTKEFGEDGFKVERLNEEYIARKTI